MQSQLVGQRSAESCLYMQPPRPLLTHVIYVMMLKYGPSDLKASLGTAESPQRGGPGQARRRKGLTQPCADL
jgi:hypothetical protein